MIDGSFCGQIEAERKRSGDTYLFERLPVCLCLFARWLFVCCLHLTMLLLSSPMTLKPASLATESEL